ncbi:AAA family ATPase [Kribbella sp. NPDC049174]|uniref:ATP-binding protein n=1 Tax=Kribbella sp. NPDC049174 TaxID=3364112 RepID=UPI0037150A93
MHKATILRAPAEEVYADELTRLAAADTGPRPEGWNLSPRAVRTFVLGDHELGVQQKFYGDDALIDRCVVTLMSNRGLLLVGEPGTAKSMLSELFAAAIGSDSTCTVQGTSGTTEDQITYSWNYALLLAEGPTQRALVKGPMYQAIEQGKVCRFEEVTRVQPEIQDVLIGLLSDKLVHVPELSGAESTVFAARGFNVLATANLRDRGVHEMSSALKRRFNFETVRPIADRRLEERLIKQQTAALLAQSNVEARLSDDVVELLVTAFHDLRDGVTAEGTVIERTSAVMSSAEAVAVGYAAGLDAEYFGGGEVGGEHVARQLIGTVLKDNPDDGKKLRHYFDVVVKQRAKSDDRWHRVLDARRELDR